MLHADHSLVDEDYAGAFAALSGEGGSPDGDDGPLDDRDRLCLLLMIERSRGRRSEWAPYLASLPAAYDDPLWWDAENFIGGFDTLEQAITAVELIDDANDVSWSRQDLFDLKGI